MPDNDNGGGSHRETNSNTGWGAYRHLVLNELTRFQEWLGQLAAKFGTLETDLQVKIEQVKAECGSKQEHGELRDKISKLEREVTALKVKAGVWGLIAGAIPVIIALILKFAFDA